MNLENIFNFIISPDFSGWLLVLKILFIIISLIFLGFIVFVLTKTSWLKRMWVWDLIEFFSFRPYGVRRMAKTWTKITSRLETGLESEYKLSVIEADSALDYILKRMEFGGETLGERLEKLTAATLPNLKQVWEAHKIRNNIVHDPDYRLTLDEARRVLGIYEQALRDLQAF
jgi:hypothetical protein